MIAGVTVYGWFVLFVALLITTLTIAAVAEAIRDRRTRRPA